MLLFRVKVKVKGLESNLDKYLFAPTGAQGDKFTLVYMTVCL